MSKIGSYFFARGGVHTSFKTALELGYTAMKIHARHPYKVHQTQIPRDHVQAYRNTRREHRGLPVFIQANKLINIASPVAKERHFATKQLEHDYMMGAYLEPTGIVVQMGNHRQLGEKHALYQATKILEKLTLKLIGHLGICTIILETSSGEGTTMGYQFEHFKHVIDGLSAPHLIEVCFDISNVFAAGYDISSADGLERSIDEFQSLLDIDRIACINLSDAEYPLGSKKRFRAPLGQGEIGRNALERIVNHPQLAAKPFILEGLVAKDHSGLHPDYKVAHELMGKPIDPKIIRAHKRVLSYQRLDYIAKEREAARRIKYGLDDDWWPE